MTSASRDKLRAGSSSMVAIGGLQEKLHAIREKSIAVKTR